MLRAAPVRKAVRSIVTWTKLPVQGTTPAARCATGSTFIPDTKTLFVSGGDGNSPFGEPLRDCWAFNANTLTWEPRAPIDEPRYYHSLVTESSSEKLFMFGGSGPKGSEKYGDLWMYTMKDDKWTRIDDTDTDLAVPRDQHGVVVADNRMIMFGGRTDKGPTNDVLSLRLDTFTWEVLFSHSDDYGPRPRGGASVSLSSCGRYLYIFGGWGVQDRCVWEFDLEEREWVKRSPKLPPTEASNSNMSPTPRGPLGWGHSACVFNISDNRQKPEDVLVVYGGVEVVEGKSSPVWKRDLWAFNTRDSTWLEIPHLVGDGPPNGLAAHSAFPMSSSIGSPPVGVEFLAFGGTCGHDPQYEGEGHRELMVNNLWKCHVKLPFETAGQDAQTVEEEKSEPAPLQMHTAM